MIHDIHSPNYALQQKQRINIAHTESHESLMILKS
jgi:hypothetical protein